MDNQDNLCYGDDDINQIETRCDLSGLLKTEHRNNAILSQCPHMKEVKKSSLMIDDTIYKDLHRICDENDLNLNSVLQFTWHKTLSIYGNSNSTIVGTSVFGGEFLPLIVHHNVESSIIDSIKTIEGTLKNVKHRYDVDAAQSVEGNMKSHFYDSLFDYRTHASVDQQLDHPLSVLVYETSNKDSLTFIINYAAELFHDHTIDDLLQTVNHLLTQITTHPFSKIADLNFLSLKQSNQVNQWNNTDQDFPLDKTSITLEKLFEEEVYKSPDNIAVVYEDVQLTYAQLNKKANQLAHYLRLMCDIRPDDLIALLLDKSELMIVSILAVWKAGGGYVPIDPSYPDERIKFILDDTKAKIIITNEQYLTRVDMYDLLKVGIELISSSIDDDQEKSQNLPSMASNRNLAYVTYTSGTTGKPKGVMKEHKSVINVIIDLTQKYHLFGNESNPEKIVLFSQYVFEPCVRQFLMALLNSHTLIIIGQDEIHDQNKFNRFAAKNKISYLNGTASILQSYDYTHLESLTRLIFAGEELTANCYTKIRQTYKQTIINEYGPTESALVSTMKMFGPNEKRMNKSIGKPLMNVKCYVLDKNLNQLPIGAIGELYIGGIGVARGYLNRPDLTAQRFLPNPFQTHQEKMQGKNARIYKTGDLVRWLPDGELEYLGRNDFQVKIRGLRIELGEIEAVLSSYPRVKQSVVLAKEHKKKNNHNNTDADTSATKYLVGYYVCDDDDEIKESDVKQFMQAMLPNYMIPNRLIRIEKIPVTINGKLDSRALPEVDLSIDETSYVAPRNEWKMKLCQLWSDLLGFEKIGIRDDFFHLGGDSISSLQMVNRLRQNYNLNISMKDIFTFKTVENLFENKLRIQLNRLNETTEDPNNEHIWRSLMPVPKYFLKGANCFCNHLNQYISFEIPKFDIDTFKDSLTKLIQHHVAFRIRFKKDDDGNFMQYYDPNFESKKINLVNFKNTALIKTNSEAEFNDSLVEKMDIESGPMYMVAFLYDNGHDGTARVWFYAHHLITDRSSLRIIIEELQELYFRRGHHSKCHHNQWSNAVQSYIKNTETDEKAYWENMLSDDITAINEILVSKVQKNSKANDRQIILSEEITKDLLNDCNQVYHTQLEHLLLTALSYALFDEITDVKENFIMFEACARHLPNCPDMSQSIGLFRTIYPIRLQLADEYDDIGASIINIKEHIKQVPNKGIGFSAIDNYEISDFPRVLFNYLGHLHGKHSSVDKWNLLDELYDNSTNKNLEEIIKIDGMIINERVILNIRTLLDIEKTADFVKSFELHIEKLITHTKSITRTYLTQSDTNFIIKTDDHLHKLQSDSEIDSIFLANSLQQGLLYHSLKQSSIDDAYIVQSIYQYRTSIDQNLFKQVWEQTQKRFGCLRLRFDWNDQLLQIIDKTQLLDWRFIDLSEEEHDVAQQQLKIQEIQENDRNERFQLDRGNLFRIYLIQQKENLFTLIFSFHHIILDGWSLAILFNYVHQNYLKLIENQDQIGSFCWSEFPDKSYEHAQMYLQTHCRENVNYWNDQIDRIEERCDLSYFLKEECKNTIVLNQYDHIQQSKTQTLFIRDILYSNLKQFSSQNALTFNSIFQFVWHKVLILYGNSNQTITGTTVSGRNLPVDEVENAMGLFINTLPLMIRHDHSISIIDAITNVQDTINELINRSNVDFSQLSKGNMKHSLFDSLFVYENYPNLKIPTNLVGKTLDVEKKYDIEKLDYPLSVIVYETTNKDSLTFIINYAAELFHDHTIDDLLQTVNHLLTQITTHPFTKIADLNFLSLKQSNQVNQWNNTDQDFPLDKTSITLEKLFEEEVYKSPDNIAVVYEDVQLTYAQLNKKANQLAHYLRSMCDIRPDDLIALLLDKSELMIVSILAVWKAGGGYVPIDPSYPDERIKFILDDTKAKIIITNEQYLTRVDMYDLLKVGIESISSSIDDDQEKSQNLPSIATNTNLAYVIYTSGTTGNPKGVMIEHTGVVNLKIALTELFELRSRPEAVLSFSNYVFDHFVEQMTYALLNSQVLVILNDEMRVDKPRLLRYLKRNKVTYLSGTPSVLQEYNYEDLKDIIRIDAVGEDFSETIFNKIRNTFQGLIINGYGPTEISITSHKRLYYQSERRTNKSIGKQIPNTSCYVLDKNLNQLPIGAIGELYIGGIGVARGYLNQPDLTAQRFLPNPFQTYQEKIQGKNARIYKTGDLVRWLPDGELEYLGRNDFQVKIRGLRIELGEIEAVLSSYPRVKQSVVLAKEHKKKNNNSDADTSATKYLVGYYVCDDDDEIEENDVKQFMQAKLPNYMIPNRLIRIEKIPVNISGKLDSRALPEVDFTKTDGNEVVVPRNDLERKIAEIWSDLLGVSAENIGIHDDFFGLGGDSILVIKLSLMLTKSLSIKLTISTIFQNKTVAKLAAYILHELDYINGQGDQAPQINSNFSTDSNYPLSSAQERLLFINDFDSDNGTNAYNIPICIKISDSRIRRDFLRQSLIAILHRHEILRTLIREDEFGIVCQHIMNKAAVNDLFRIDEIPIASNDQLDDELLKMAKSVFNLRVELPIKVRFYELKNSDDPCSTTLYIGLLIHHICFDGWSWIIFWRDLQIFYDYFKKQHYNISSDISSSSNLPPLHIQYKDFAVWQRNYLTGKKLNNLLEFWKDKLDGFEIVNLISDYPTRPSTYDYSGNEISFELDQATTTAIKQLAMKLNVSLFSLLFSAYTLMLSNYANQQDIIIGTPVINRNQPELKNLIGFFVNMLVLRTRIEAQDSMMKYITKVNDEVISAQIHQEMPFERLVKELQIENDPSRHPIVQVIFVMNNYFEPKTSVADKSTSMIRMSEYVPKQSSSKIAKYDLSVSINETDVCLKGHFNYATKIFKDETVHNFVHSFVHILTQVSELAETTKVMDIECNDPSQSQQIEQWSHPCSIEKLSMNTPKTLDKLFEDQVLKSPNNIAVVYEDVQLTYAQLNQKANQLAHYLRLMCDIRPDDLIALLLDKSELMIVSILAVWKAGGGYVPIDPSYPDERIEFILDDTKAKIIIINDKYLTRVDMYDSIRVNIDFWLLDPLSTHPNWISNPHSYTNENNLAYVIYTSGTTGRPKGVLIEHGGVVSFRNDITRRYFNEDNNARTSEAILFFSNYVFDFSIEQLSLSILDSKTLIVLQNTYTIDDHLYRYLNENRLTYLSGTPTQLQQINLKKLKYLRTLTIAGEALSERLFQKIRQEYKGKVINAYGVTETTVYNMVYVYENATTYRNSIGSLLSNTKRFVLNQNMKKLPVHAIGELYMTGDCMSRGYLNRPDLTAQRFLPNPFQTHQEKIQGKNARIYKTGDLVRWLPDGELEYLGRNDFQVKIRGLRIELGEIEAVLSSYPRVKQSVVLAKEHKKKNNNSDADTSATKYLVGYFVCDDDDEIKESDVKQFMQAKLPNYMIPNRLIRIEKIPVTINGKLDSRALPEVDLSIDETSYVAPRNEWEMKLCQLWSDLLGMEKVGIRDDFFRLGGDSISSLQMVGRIRKELSLVVAVKDIFLFKTIEGLFDNVLFSNLKGKIANQCDSYRYEQNVLSGDVPLLPIQEWFFLKEFKSYNHWNQAFLIETQQLNLGKLQDSLSKLVDHHDAFRLRFKRIDHTTYIQYYDCSLTTTNMFTLNYLDVRNLNHEENRDELLKKILTDWQRHFNIENGPVFAVGYLTGFDDGKARIWFAMHHLIIDVVSWRIIREDLHRLYHGSANLGLKGSSYRQWSQRVQSYAINHSSTEGIYWRSVLNDVLRFNNNLSKHVAISNNQLGTMTSVILSASQTAVLLRDCPHAYNTQINVLLLTTLGYALRSLTHDRVNCVTLEGHGREDLDDDSMDTSRTVGWFTTMYPVLLEIDDDLTRSIVNVTKHVMQIPNKGIGYGSIIGYKNQDLPRVSFNYLGQFETASFTRTSNNNRNNGWYLTNGIIGQEIGDDPTDRIDDVIAVNGFCREGQMRFDIKTRMNNEVATAFTHCFKSKLEDVIRECYVHTSSTAVDYSIDFEHPFVVFNENSDKVLFILPPGEGGAESYFNNIVPYLSSYKLIVFNNYYLDLKAKNMEYGFSFEILTHLYIKYIKQIQRSGPYNFLGWSFGGVLSFEISRQLNNAGDTIANIFLIDSYFNIGKALFEIDEVNKVDIIDQINYLYLPKINNEIFAMNIVNMNINITLFKAMKVNEDYFSNDQLKLFTYYSNTSFNHLDTLIDNQYIQLFQMHDDSHFSWVFNKEQIKRMCNYILRVLN